MNVSVKLEPGIIEDTNSLPDEFLDEKSDIPNVKTITNKRPKTANTSSSNQKPGKVSKVTKKKRNSLNIAAKIEENCTTAAGEFTPYFKKQFLNLFLLEGCSPQTIAKYANCYNLKVEEINEYFNQAAKEAQHYVYQECDSLSFNNINDWLKYFQATGVSQQCNYEAAIVMNAIANNEYHPDPSTIGGINLKEIYQFLSNALMGLPQKQLDESSAKFLSNEFENLINEANTDVADNDVRNMKLTIEKFLGQTVNKNCNNLDPLCTNTIELEKCYSTMFNPNIKCENGIVLLEKNENK